LLVLVLVGLAGRAWAAGLAVFPSVVEGRDMTFPADTGAHPDYRTEWWYVTGWLEDEQGVERGFQVTFFRVRSGIGEGNPSRFAPSQIMLAHAALADPAVGRLLHGERTERAMAPLAGAAEDLTRAWVGDWSLALEDEFGHGRYRARVSGEDFAFDLTLTAGAAPLRNGKHGYSQKAPDPLNASYYYSRPQLMVDGSLTLHGEVRKVRGHAWLDHEWSSALMPDGAQGWDWVGINLHDGGSLMAFRMRDGKGAALWAGGTLRAGGEAARRLGPGQVVMQPLRHWRSPRSGVEYPVGWRLDIDGRQFELRPLMDDQELDSRRSTGAIYWEGAVRLFEDGREIGQGYLEMTGYAERLRM
jgi:predicted secreted hydrolase